MKLLLIDTCGTTGTVALADESVVIADATLPERTASERLVASIKDLAASAGSPLAALDAIAVVHGPGSFTGVRVGLSAAKGLSEALELPIVAISRLAVLAHMADMPAAILVHALLDAGRGEFYSGIYSNGIRQREALLTRAELFAAVAADPGQQIVVCEQVVAQSIPTLSPKLVAEPTAAAAIPLALRRLSQRDFDDAATLDANYLRRTDAEIFAKPVVGTIVR
jgi:tRNA threonylcarbamoyladenosine biosynthesis protein TsaB